MILVNVKSTWRLVLAGGLSPAEATLGHWHQVPDARIDAYGDAIAGVYRHRIVSVYDIQDYTRGDDDRVTFTGTPSACWAHLIGTPTPARWRPGQGRPVKYIDSALLTSPIGAAA